MQTVPRLATALLLLSVASPISARVHRGPTSAKSHTTKPKSSKTAKATKATKDKPGPRAITDERATEIQTALVKAGYLPEVTGRWDAASQAAMQKLQADNGWQTKLIPDSRAIIKLGLGPGNAPASSLPATNATATGIVVTTVPDRSVSAAPVTATQ